MIYKTLILPRYDYYDVAYDGMLQKLKDNLHRLQNMCLKSVFKVRIRTSTNLAHTQAKLPLLDKRRWGSGVIIMHRVAQKKSPLNICVIFQSVSGIHRIDTRQGTNLQYYHPKVKLEFEHCNFCFRRVKIWEEVSAELHTENSTQIFKNLTYQWIMQ